ncbi:glycine--tRNA ligase subunit beta [Verminephrobacter aporrectodeae]|uniref:glycine--tRNA ligase subunit beta n=2 Tax=Verminephrobacter aporrectodeae TaxID=1110389 RepID=UPI0022385B1D|nr:glycine--tRNA ligase subunit beta [Verminephrobacter aporrectodeae]MCW5222526.1 glycine--tRNA ligase subunit beta [Verminephrobacter aporrectodeae subsp. tuberculatae]MCW5257265.1 glycine--tRNA ligase subunit beta [Verminephrobacter aporrectodeae subsp. tuberculatae]MCW5287991.1 glycine--tRNA ligase subunit beta [Verminephrobacter aporrectodeae subsp. tuberculatae]MCW8175005.1 glycine--tRNA ligase subunit beta [Verminephrobacter aporrectodeae subsp. tuberculatae]MCW8201602.1 glycine--tRNA l
MTVENLLVELLVEELPPKALRQLGDAFASVLGAQLEAQGLTSAASAVTPFASPRRLAAHVSAVSDKAADRAVRQKLMPVAVGLDAEGNATPALLRKLQALGADLSDPAAAVAALGRAPDGRAEALFHDSIVAGATLQAGLQRALHEAITKLPIPKVMSYQLARDCELPGWTSVQFVRPAHGLVALHGSTVVPVTALGLRAGRSTQGHRFEAAVTPVVLADADSYAATLRKDGAVIASFAERRAEVARQLAAVAAQAGGGARAIADDALLDEVTALVERPNVLLCAFEPQFLEVPQECLILTMQANQKYFPLLDAAGRLSNRFLVVSNICPQDASLVTGGNERVVRPRLADAKFFFEQDRRKTLASRVESLDKVVYHNQLGTQRERTQRVRALVQAIARQLGDAALAAQADLAALLAKTDLVTDMVGEFPELQGTMGRYYALNDGLDGAVADAIEDHYKPRFAGDSLPRNLPGVVLALADKLETLVGMFGIGKLPTGERDPFALRRHALGVIRMLVEKDLPLDLNALLADALPAFGDKITDPSAALADFIYERLAGSLREQGYSAQEVDAVLALRPQRLALVARQLAAVRAFAALPESPALAAANKRVANILKKAGDVDAHVNPDLLQEKAEQDLYAALQRFVPEADAQFDAGDYTASLQTLAVLRAPVDAFFDDVMVNAEQMDLRLNRQGLLKSLHGAMNRVADLSRLAI